MKAKYDDVSINHTRFCWCFMPLVNVHVTLPMCTLHGWYMCALDDNVYRCPIFCARRSQSLDDASWHWNIQMSPNQCTHIKDNLCRPFHMICYIIQRRFPNVHIPCHIPVDLGWGCSSLVDVTFLIWSRLDLWCLSLANVDVTLPMYTPWVNRTYFW